MFVSKRLVFYFVTVVLFFSCREAKKEKAELKKFVSEKIMVDDQVIPYQYDSIAKIIENVGLCKIPDSTDSDTALPPCDYRLLRYFATSNEPYKNGFLLEIKPRVWSNFFLVVNIALNSSGDFYKSNAFHGQLLELRTTEKGPYDLVIRYIDAEVGTVAILHKWNKTKYDPVEVLEINDRFIKPEKKDSLNNVYLKDFVWGY